MFVAVNTVGNLVRARVHIRLLLVFTHIVSSNHFFKRYTPDLLLIQRPCIKHRLSF